MADRRYYVYLVFTRTGIPHYVGYGKGRRGQNAAHGAPVVKLAEHLTKSEAHRLERVWIAAIGRAPNGPLVNIVGGGAGKYDPPEKLRKAMSTAMSVLVWATDGTNNRRVLESEIPSGWVRGRSGYVRRVTSYTLTPKRIEAFARVRASPARLPNLQKAIAKGVAAGNYSAGVRKGWEKRRAP